MQAQAAELAGYAGQFFCNLKKKHFKTGCIQVQISNLAIKQARKRLFNSLLTRIDRVDFSKRVIYAG
jgi:hypothetical protein